MKAMNVCVHVNLSILKASNVSSHVNLSMLKAIMSYASCTLTYVFIHTYESGHVGRGFHGSQSADLSCICMTDFVWACTHTCTHTHVQMPSGIHALFKDEKASAQTAYGQSVGIYIHTYINTYIDTHIHTCTDTVRDPCAVQG